MAPDARRLLAMTTEYAVSRGCPEPYLRRIAEAGFTHIHWAHHFNTDFMYGDSEIEQIAWWLEDYGLTLLNVHGSVGFEKNYSSLLEYERQAGVDLIRNRIDFAARLSASVVILHLPIKPETIRDQAFWDQVSRSFEDVSRFAYERGVRIAIENRPADDFIWLRMLLNRFDSDLMGLCYDAGHGNIGPCGLVHLDALRDRLLAIHLHDNDGAGDQHDLPFSGTVAWQKLIPLLAGSAYQGPITIESNIRGYDMTDDVFLEKAYEAGLALDRMLNLARETQEVVEA